MLLFIRCNNEKNDKVENKKENDLKNSHNNHVFEEANHAQMQNSDSLVGKWTLKNISNMPHYKHYSLSFPQDSLFETNFNKDIFEIEFMSSNRCILNNRDTVEYSRNKGKLVFKKQIVSPVPIFTTVFDINLYTKIRLSFRGILFDFKGNEIGTITYLFYKKE